MGCTLHEKQALLTSVSDMLDTLNWCNLGKKDARLSMMFQSDRGMVAIRKVTFHPDINKQTFAT